MLSAELGHAPFKRVSLGAWSKGGGEAACLALLGEARRTLMGHGVSSKLFKRFREPGMMSLFEKVATDV